MMLIILTVPGPHLENHSQLASKCHSGVKPQAYCPDASKKEFATRVVVIEEKILEKRKSQSGKP